MRVDTNFLNFLKTYFVSRDAESTIASVLAPSTNEGTDLGKAFQRFDKIYARTVIADNFASTGSGASNADTLDGYHASSTATADTILPLDGSGIFPTSVYPSALLVDGTRTLTGNLSVNPGVTIDGVDISAFYSAYSGHAHTLSSITDPAASKTFDMDDNTLAFSFNDPAGVSGAFEVEATGVFTGDLVRIHQHTGNPGATNLLAIEAEDADVVPLVVTGTGSYSGKFIGGVIYVEPAIETAPFYLHLNAHGQTVTGLQSDSVNKSVLAGDGISGGGLLTADVTISVSLKALSGLEVDGDGLALDDAIAGDGLEITDKVLAISFGSTLDIDTDQLVVNEAADFTWTGEHVFQDTITTRSLVPELTDAYDIGTSLLLYSQAYISQLNSVIFATNTVTLLGGWLIVGKNEGSLAGTVGSADTTVDFGQAMTTGHFILIRAADTSGTVKAEYMEVGTLVSGTTYNVTRDLAAAHGTDPEWAAGVPYVVLGEDGDGRIEINSYDTPRIQILEQGSAYNTVTEHVRLGDLNGWGPVVSSAFGWAVGSYDDDVYAYYTTADGLIVRGTIRADDGYLGTLSIDGVLSIGSSGGIYQGTGSFASPTTGLKVWNDSGVGRIGGYSGGDIQWYADTDGVLYAGGGSVILNSDGLSLESYTTTDPDTVSVLKIIDTGNSDRTALTLTARTSSTAVYGRLSVGDDWSSLGDDYNTADLQIAVGVADDSTNEATITIFANNYPELAYLSSNDIAIISLTTAGNDNAFTANKSNIKLSATHIFLDVTKSTYDGFVNVQGGAIIGSGPVTSTTTPDDGDLFVKGGIAVGIYNPASDNPPDGAIDFYELSSVPATPSSGYGRLFASTSAPYYVNDGGYAFGAFVDRIFIPAWVLRTGGPATPTMASISQYQGWRIPTSGTNYLDTLVPLPFAWGGRTYTAYVYWAAEDAGSGNVYEQCSFWTGVEGSAIPSSAVAQVTLTTTNPGQNIINVSEFSPGAFSVNSSERMFGIRWVRYGDNLADTYAGDILVFGIELRVSA